MIVPGDLFEIVENGQDHPCGHDVAMVVSVRNVQRGYRTDVGYGHACGHADCRVATLCRRPNIHSVIDASGFLPQWEAWECYVESCMCSGLWVRLVEAHR